MLRFPILMLFVSAACTMPATAATPMDINWLIAQTLANSEQLRAVQSRIQRQEVELDIARDNRLPAFSGFVEHASGSDTRQQLRVSQTVYDWGTTSDKIESARLERQQIELEYARFREEEAEEIALLFLEWSSADARTRVLGSHLERLNALKRITDRRVGTVVDRGELSRVSAAIAGSKIELALARSALNESRDQIHERIRQRVDLALVDEMPGFADWFAEGLSVSELAKHMTSAFPVREAELEITEAEIERNLADAEWRPKLSVEAIAERTEDRFGTDTDQRIALRIEAPVFQGLSPLKRPKSAAYAIRTAEIDRDRSLREVRRTVRRLLNSLRLQSNRGPLIAQQVMASRETVELYTQQFEIGRRDMSDLIGAESERLRAELSSVDLQFEKQRLSLRLASTLGLFTKKLLKNGEGNI